MIPKIIHYCWFGKNPLPDIAKKCINSWRQFCPDYEIKEWNETNYNLNSCLFVKEAYEAKKWAFVSDFARLDIIYNEGGIYLDLDVEILKNLDDFLNGPCFFGLETTGMVNTGIGFGAEKWNEIVKLLMHEYEKKHFILKNGEYDVVPCPEKNTQALIKAGYKFNRNQIFRTCDITIFPPEWFCPLDYETGKLSVTENTVSIHHYTASWHNKAEMRKEQITRYCIVHFGNSLGRTIADIISIPYRFNIKVDKVLKAYQIRGEKQK